MIYQLYAVRIFVNDWYNAITFYRDILDMTVFMIDDRNGWAQFEVGNAYLGIERANEDSQDLVGRFVGLSLAVEDIHESYEKLTEAGIEFTGPPEKQSWGGYLAHFKDTEGNILTLLGG